MRNELAAAVLALTLPIRAFAADTAHAVLKDAKGQEVGAVHLTEEKGAVALSVNVKGLPPGRHGIHVHAVGKCEPPAFASAGPHLNPAARKHGLENPEGHHEGDLPNLVVGSDGRGTLTASLAGATLGAGPASLLGPQGTAVVIHADPDDQKTDPAGTSGARIACGVVARGR